MDNFLFYIFIPGLTLLLPGRTNWFQSNFSVAGSTFPGNILLFFWAVIVSRSFHTFVKRTIGQTAPYLNPGKAPALTDLSACLLVGCTFLPYQPERAPVLAFLHLMMAFSSTVIFYTALAIFDLKLYFLAPDLFSLPTALNLYAIAMSFALLIVCDFLISSALELFLTMFACLWLPLMEGRVNSFVEIQSLKNYMAKNHRHL